MPVIPPDHYYASWTHNQAATLRPAIVTLGVRYLGDSNDFQTNATLLGLAWGNVLGSLANSIAWNRFTLAEQAGIIFESTHNTPGGDTDAGAPYNVAYLVRKVTARPGRANRGRMYLPGVTELDINSAGILTGAQFDTLSGAMDAFQSAILNADFQPVLLHDPPKTGGPAPAPTVIQDFVVDMRVATQRRRLRG